MTHPKLQYVNHRLINSTYQNITAKKNLTFKRFEEFEEQEQEAIAAN